MYISGGGGGVSFDYDCSSFQRTGLSNENSLVGGGRHDQSMWFSLFPCYSFPCLSSNMDFNLFLSTNYVDLTGALLIRN